MFKSARSQTSCPKHEISSVHAILILCRRTDGWSCERVLPQNIMLTEREITDHRLTNHGNTVLKKDYVRSVPVVRYLYWDIAELPHWIQHLCHHSSCLLVMELHAKNLPIEAAPQVKQILISFSWAISDSVFGPPSQLWPVQRYKWPE